jgi:hypothetical protein
MAKIKIRDWVEPAHPVLVQRYDDIIEIYRFIQGTLQEGIDEIFDKVSKQIGFVVTTTLPVTVQIAANNKIEKAGFTAANLQGTLFENAFSPILEKISGAKGIKASAGSYPLLLLWHEALRLKLKADWIEPAHFRTSLGASLQATVAGSLASQLNPGVREPAHWFDAGISLDNEEEILIAAIDEVYTDLKLAERVAVARRETMKYIPGIREPAHVPGIREPAHFRAIIEDMIETRAALPLSPGIREPAHFRRFEELLEREDAAQLLSELTAVMKKYGL